MGCAVFALVQKYSGNECNWTVIFNINFKSTASPVHHYMDCDLHTQIIVKLVRLQIWTTQISLLRVII